MIKFLIPTAKEMSLGEASFPHQMTAQSSAIIHELSNLSTEQLAQLYKIKEEAARVEAQRIRAIKTDLAPAYPALDLFNGLMYRQIKRKLSAEERSYLEQHVFITSSLYGIIPALKPIAPHRLDFNLKVKVNGQSLKQHWRQDYDNFVQAGDTIVSLLSSEFVEVFSADLRKKFITVKFMEEKNGQLKVHSTISKKARGKFLSQAMEKRILKAEDLKDLTFDQFAYQPQLSQANQLVFVKKES